MAQLQELISYLEKGFTIQSVRGETIRMISSPIVEWWRPSWHGGLEPEKCRLAEVRMASSIWDWGVVFVADQKSKPFCLTGLQEIEEAIKNNVPRAVYGASSPEE